MLGIASLTLGHPSKNGNGSARGAGAQEDAGDVNLSLTMHRGEIGDKDGVIALRVTKNRLLGLGVPPLYLRRIGQDQFKPLDKEDVEKMTDEDKPQTSQEKVDAAIIDYLTKRSGEPARHTDIVKQLMADGMKEGTIKVRISELQSMGKFAHDLKRGYILASEV